MKHSAIVHIDDNTLILAISSDVSWLPLEVGDYVDTDDARYCVHTKVFKVETEQMFFYVK